MSIAERLAQVRALYSDNVRRLGAESSAVGWNSDQSHLLRFAKLAEVLEENKGPITVNDYGCGYGALLPFLVRNLGIEVTSYCGYDISHEMLDAAKKELSWFTGEIRFFDTADMATDADYSFVSGTFNVKFDATDEEWTEFMRKKLDDLARWSKRGFAFNALTSYVDWRESHLYYADPCRWFDYCKRSVSKRVSLLHDTPLFEWTMIVRTVP